MTVGNGAAAPPGDEDVKRRVRFDAEADLRLLQAVVKREPFAADHGTKLKAWDDVADEVYATATKLRDVPSSRRAVTDRFHHLLLRYEQGTLKLKRWTDTPNGAEKATLVVNLFRLITARMADIRNSKAQRTSSSSSGGGGSGGGDHSSISSLADLASESSRRSGAASAPDAEANDDKDDVETEDDESNDTSVTVNEAGSAEARASLAHSYHASIQSSTHQPKQSRLKRSHADAAFQTELLALKREKLELKRQKLALLRDQHEQRMALERQRLEIATQQLEEARRAHSGAPSTTPP